MFGFIDLSNEPVDICISGCVALISQILFGFVKRHLTWVDVIGNRLCLCGLGLATNELLDFIRRGRVPLGGKECLGFVVRSCLGVKLGLGRSNRRSFIFLANQLGGFFVCKCVAFSSGSGFDFSKVEHLGVNIRFGAACQRHVGALTCQCFDICIRVCEVITLSQRRSSFVTAGVVGIVNGVHQVGLDGVIRDTKLLQSGSGGSRIALVGFQDVGDLWVALDDIGDDITGAACTIRTPSDWATSNNAERSRLCDFLGNVTSLVELVQLTFKCSLCKTFFTAFGHTFFDGNLRASLGKVAKRLHSLTQTGASPTQNSFLKSRTTDTHGHGGSSRSNKRLALCNLHGNLVRFRRSLTHFDGRLVRFVVRTRSCTASRFGNVSQDTCGHTCGATHLGGNRLAVLQRSRSTLGTRGNNATNEKRRNFLDTFNANVLGQEGQWSRFERAVDCLESSTNTFGIANYGVHVLHCCLILSRVAGFAQIVYRVGELAQCRVFWRRAKQHRDAVDRFEEPTTSFQHVGCGVDQCRVAGLLCPANDRFGGVNHGIAHDTVDSLRSTQFGHGKNLLLLSGFLTHYRDRG